MVELSPNQFQGVQMKDIPTVEELLILNILLYDKNFVKENTVRELSRRSVQNYETTVRLLRYNNHIFYVNNINAIFQSFRCPDCDTLLKRTFNLQQHLITCTERVKNVYPRNVYQIRETLLGKLDSSGINYTSELKRFRSLALFNFQSLSVHEETFKVSNTITWIRKHVPISLSISSNLVEGPIFR